MTKAFYVTAIFNMKITEDLGKGIEIRDGIFLTNNKTFIKSLLTEPLEYYIGVLEFEALNTHDYPIFYKIEDVNITAANGLDLLAEFIMNCRIIINELWLIRDHSVNIMMGYVEHPYANSSTILLPQHRPIVQSNTMTGASHPANGVNSTTIFTKSDIEQVIKWGANTTILSFAEVEKRKTIVTPGTQRMTLATAFLQVAREQTDLGLKITNYCSGFECIFSTDSVELTHKLSERIAYFLEADVKKRIELFSALKKIYSIRSYVVHGSAISEKLVEDIVSHSEMADSIFRRILIKLLEDRRYDKYYRQENRVLLEKYLLELTLGYNQHDSLIEPL